MTSHAAALCTLTLLAGCTGAIADPEAGELQPLAASTAGSGAAAPAPGKPGEAPAAQPGQPTPVGPSLSCRDQAAVMPGRAPLRRLTRFEYNNSVRELFGDATEPARALPSEEIGNGFGNDADAQSVSSLLAEQYAKVAEGVAQRATETPAALGRLDACASAVTDASESGCARSVIERTAGRAYRRALPAAELDELLGLFGAAREGATFQIGIATVIEAVLQAPDFLYRVELGEPDARDAALRRPSGDEMATRLSYLFWAGPPDDALRAAARSGELASAAGVLSQARRLVDDPKARPIVRFFFDNLLPIANLAQLERDATMYPSFKPAIGGLMREETQRFLEHEIFSGSGTWPGALTANYTLVNDVLAKYYGMSGVSGSDWQKVATDPSQRLGLLTQGGMLAGTTPSNHTNPVLRGSFVVQKLMCRPLMLPSDPAILAKVKPPDPYTGKTARERFGAHSKDPVCAGCHQFMDPIGLTFENYDAVGLYRTQENGETIDASGALPGTPGEVANALELVQALAASAETQACFAQQWMSYAYGRALDPDEPADDCTIEQVGAAFEKSGYDVRQLLLELTQTDAFLYLPASRE